MNRQDQRAIDDLYARLENVETETGRRDADAEASSGERIVAQPSAPYYMAQTIIVQNQALEAAQKRIDALEGTRDEEPGLFGGLFGGGRSRGSVPRSGRRQPAYEPAAGGGFLAGAAQTAMGVAGGVLLGNMLAGAFFGNSAEAGESDNADPGAVDANADDSSEVDGGGDFGSGDFDAGDF